MNKFIKGFQFAINGIFVAFKEQLNLKVHAGAASLIILAAIFFKITSLEWIILVIAITSVITFELINTAIEYVVDLVSPQQNPIAGKIKDIAAGAVLVASIGALVIGFLIFSKYIFNF